MNNVDKVEVAMIRMDQLRGVQAENLNQLIDKESKVDTLLEQADLLTIQSGQSVVVKKVLISWLTSRPKL